MKIFLTHLECTNCGLRHEWQTLENLCTKCAKPLFPRYKAQLEAQGREDLVNVE